MARLVSTCRYWMSVTVPACRRVLRSSCRCVQPVQAAAARTTAVQTRMDSPRLGTDPAGCIGQGDGALAEIRPVEALLRGSGGIEIARESHDDQETTGRRAGRRGPRVAEHPAHVLVRRLPRPRAHGLPGAPGDQRGPG